MFWKNQVNIYIYIYIYIYIRRIDRIQNVWERELCKVKKGLDERIDEGKLQWFGHMDRMENDRNANSVYVGKHDDSSSVV